MDKKVGKLEAHYQTHPRGIAHCARCGMFRSPHSCVRVAGDISPRGWSKFFEWKDQRTHQAARMEQARVVG